MKLSSTPLQNQTMIVLRCAFTGDYPYGSSQDNQLVWGRDAQKSLWRHPLGGQFEIENASGTLIYNQPHTMLSMDDDTNFTYVIDYDAAAENKFVVGTDRTGGSGVLMSISSLNSGLVVSRGFSFRDL